LSYWNVRTFWADEERGKSRARSKLATITDEAKRAFKEVQSGTKMKVAEGRKTVPSAEVHRRYFGTAKVLSCGPVCGFLAY
jgi:hypothetical protein